jgi:hypothetical protein
LVASRRFFGASGAKGIATGALPKMFDKAMDKQRMKGQGPTAGGESLGLSPLCGLPEDLKTADVQRIVNNKISVAQIVKKYPIEGNFWAKDYG